MNKMIVSNLVHRPIRSLISIFAVAVEVTLMLVIVGLMFGMLNDQKDRQAGIGADAMVRPPGSSMILSASGSPLSVKVGGVLAKLDHVTAVTPVLLQSSTSGALETIYGIDLPSWDKMGSPFRYLSGGPFQGPNDIIVDDYSANSSHLRVGQTIQVLNHEFRICGIAEHGKGGRKFVPMTTLQDLTNSAGKASIFYVKLDDPQNFAAFKQEVLGVPGMGQYLVESVKEWLSLFSPESLPGFSITVKVVIGIAVCIGFIVIFQSMYTAVMERTREIGILKSLGASKSYIVNIILRETTLLAVLGIAVGIAISFTTGHLLLMKFPTIRIDVGAEHWVWKSAVIAILGAMIGAVYPAFKAAQKDPIDALAYE
ncbi:MAG: ABC transporter permease [Acidobacteria bacterium]|nr:ABC transporter permease [Acidobacteriota bacterium]MBV9147076.1 ABC transporter permease [Acidobacteriota bacterium]MBV9437945.1 ABC transporter permease [Acidobacteriota bacterium]